MGLGGRMATTVAVVAAVAAALVGMLLYSTTQPRLVQEVDTDLQRVASALLAPTNGEPGAAASIDLENLTAAEASAYSVQVLGPAGEITATTPGGDLPVTGAAVAVATGQQPASLNTVDDPGTGTQLRILTVPTDDGAIQVAQSMTAVNAILTDLGRATVIVVVLVAAGGAVVGWLMSFGVTQRVRRLTTAAEQVGTSGRLDAAVPVTGKDEAGRLGRAFDRMLTSLADSQREQRRLVEDAGHELRTPLTSLRTNVDVLLRHDDLDPELRAQLLADLDRDLIELVTLVEEVAAVAADPLAESDVKPLKLADVARSAADRCGRRTHRPIVLTADGSTVLADATSMERAISNMIDNALKFDPSDESIEVVIHDGTVTVSDRGPGITDDQADAVFQRFHRSAEARQLPGSGLGLAIVAKVAHDHGGTVFARSRSGGGAEVGFSLPLV